MCELLDEYKNSLRKTKNIKEQAKIIEKAYKDNKLKDNLFSELCHFALGKE